MGKGKSKVAKKDNSSKMARIQANKVKRQAKYETEREKRKGTKNEQSKEVLCQCGKTVKIRNYKLKNDSYKCYGCRYPKKEDLNETTNYGKSVSGQEGKRKDYRKTNSRSRTFRK